MTDESITGAEIFGKKKNGKNLEALLDVWTRISFSFLKALFLLDTFPGEYGEWDSEERECRMSLD